jgi:hypothetical protein
MSFIDSVEISSASLTADEWSCSYTVIKFGKTESSGFTGFGSGNTEEESKQQALERARGRIDSIE